MSHEIIIHRLRSQQNKTSNYTNSLTIATTSPLTAGQSFKNSSQMQMNSSIGHLLSDNQSISSMNFLIASYGRLSRADAASRNGRDTVNPCRAPQIDHQSAQIFRLNK